MRQIGCRRLCGDTVPSAVSTAAALQLLRQPRWYSFHTQDLSEERLYLVNVQSSGSRGRSGLTEQPTELQLAQEFGSWKVTLKNGDVLESGPMDTQHDDLYRFSNVMEATPPFYVDVLKIPVRMVEKIAEDEARRCRMRAPIRPGSRRGCRRSSASAGWGRQAIDRRSTVPVAPHRTFGWLGFERSSDYCVPVLMAAIVLDYGCRRIGAAVRRIQICKRRMRPSCGTCASWGTSCSLLASQTSVLDADGCRSSTSPCRFGRLPAAWSTGATGSRRSSSLNQCRACVRARGFDRQARGKLCPGEG
jgi:hypothetical protein